ncbi:hypothetical protein CSW00_19790 [Pseudomonas asiatica]|nr:hypothetical protein CSW00_19790 [Pseudomonas sp. MR 02]TXI08660.1 MAG: hypothetical protein E6Q70_02010 [Pseudomonas monteilii]
MIGRFRILGAALRPYRDTRPLLQGSRISCRSSLALRMGCKAAPGQGMQNTSLGSFTTTLRLPSYSSTCGSITGARASRR